MKAEIKKITIGELDDFVRSKLYEEFENVPISPARASSYIHNPNARPDDTALILGFNNNKLVAYRSLFAGKIETGKKSVRFGWCSGNWVHPDFRRKGFSKQLLKIAYSDWNRKLMFTNYAPESEHLYLQTGWFHQIHHFQGVRAYLRPRTRKLLPVVNKSFAFKTVFFTVDLLILSVTKIKTFFYKSKKNPHVKFERLTEPDGQIYRYLNSNNQKLVFGRKEREVKWVFQHPWISDENAEVESKYQFSARSKSFFYRVVKIFLNKQFSGFFIFSVKNGHLKTLYFSIENDLEEEVARFLKNYCVKYKIEMATVYNSAVAGHLFERKFPFLHVKKYGQKIYSSFEVKGIQNYEFQDGDGDVIFT